MSGQEFSDYIVYVDEAGHASPEPDPLFPCFVLAFCLFEKATSTSEQTKGHRAFPIANCRLSIPNPRQRRLS
ncbi:hypothetical protein BH23VER1_BH23VER1_18060 [soil metagenome]